MIEVIGWLCLAGTLIVFGLIGGVFLNDWLEEHRGKVLDAREAKLQAEWRALITAQRLNAAFMEARRAMWEEAIRQHHQRPGTP